MSVAIYFELTENPGRSLVNFHAVSFEKKRIHWMEYGDESLSQVSLSVLSTFSKSLQMFQLFRLLLKKIR